RPHGDRASSAAYIDPMIRIRRTTAGVFIALLCLHRPIDAQRAPGDSIPLRADYRDLAELLQALPNASAPALDETRALWLGALPMSCLDRLQGRPGRGGGRVNAPSVDTSSGRGVPRPAGRTASQDSNTAGRGAGANTGAGYFWVASYSLVPDHDRLRAFWG